MTLSKKKNFLEKIIKLEKAFMLLKKPHVEVLIEKILYQIKKTLNKKGKIIFCGNGGSASDSLHLTAELVGRFKKNRKALPAISLNSEISSITAIANDFGYENIFKRQFQALAKKNDLLIAFSTSGRSKNIIKVLNEAKRQKIFTILFTSNKIKNNKVANIIFKAPTIETDEIQEIHICLGHYLCQEIEKFKL